MLRSTGGAGLKAMNEAKNELAVVLARALCKGIGRDDIHALVDQLYDNYEANTRAGL